MAWSQCIGSTTTVDEYFCALKSLSMRFVYKLMWFFVIFYTRADLWHVVYLRHIFCISLCFTHRVYFICSFKTYLYILRLYSSVLLVSYRPYGNVISCQRGYHNIIYYIISYHIISYHIISISISVSISYNIVLYHIYHIYIISYHTSYHIYQYTVLCHFTSYYTLFHRKCSYYYFNHFHTTSSII